MQSYHHIKAAQSIDYPAAYTCYIPQSPWLSTKPVRFAARPTLLPNNYTSFRLQATSTHSCARACPTITAGSRCEPRYNLSPPPTKATALRDIVRILHRTVFLHGSRSTVHGLSFRWEVWDGCTVSWRSVRRHSKCVLA